MRRLKLVIPSLLVFIGCASIQPFSSTAPIRSDINTAFNCATMTLNSMGYIIKDANKDAGFIKAERQRPPKFLETTVWFDQLSVSIFTDPSTQLTMRATGTTVSGNLIDVPSEQLKKDVETVATSCGK